MGRRSGAGAGAAAQFNLARHPDAALERRTGYWHIREPGQHGFETDCGPQHAAAGPGSDRSLRRVADRSARQRDQRSVEIDGCSGRQHRCQPGQRVYQCGHSARRCRPGLPVWFHVTGDTEPHRALQRQSCQVRRGVVDGHASERLQHRRGSEQGDHLGADRRRPAAARPDFGAGADPGRSARRDTRQLALRSDYAGHGGDVGLAIRLRSQCGQPAARQQHQPDLYE
ncbi:hypothetical protein GALL_526910 [mine drainage metagenome]|uniref:Uncharacterized protein n=1 Tax=mine drainage metagenome TaxID=410659 RepID=A0A1J5PKC7_9ZZZZ